jgi:hypothetical protein
LSGSKHTASAPNQLHVGTIDISPFLPFKGSQSEGNVHGLASRKLWGDRVEEVCLPSTLGLPSTEAKKIFETACPLFEEMISDKEAHEVIKECDQAQYSSTMHVTSLDSTVPLSKKEDDSYLS